ncbi:MAG: DNA mismatch repair protein MutS [Eubacteriales bacterium]
MTPMMNQYKKIKANNPDSILFFRLGDFYEMFHEDAILAAEELNLTLTTRDRNKPEPERTPMCGVPYHSSEGYIARLIAKGYKVSICEQTEDPATTKGLVEREVVRVITPGTVMDESMLEDGKNNYIAGVYLPEEGETKIALSLCDLSTGDFFVRGFSCDLAGESELKGELARFAPSEVVLSPEGSRCDWLCEFITVDLEGQMSSRSVKGEGEVFTQFANSHHLLTENHNVLAINLLLSYLKETQKTDLRHLSTLTLLKQGEFLELDIVARRNLELTETLWTREKKGTLLGVLDKTKTAMGGRLIRTWVERPLRSVEEISTRHQAVEDITKSNQIEDITNCLKSIPDLERMIGRISFGNAGGRDLLAFGQGLATLPDLKKVLCKIQNPHLRSLETDITPLPELSHEILSAIVEKPPHSIREGGLIREGYNPEVDRLNHILTHCGEVVAEIESKTKEETGIRNLRVRYNKVFGYFIEVAKAQSEKVPSHWVRKQTTVNSERYISEELKELEHTILTAKEQVTALETKIFINLRNNTCSYIVEVQKTAKAVAQVDVLRSFAQVAIEQRYCKPEMEDSKSLSIVEGRHPVVEKVLKNDIFVPNDTNLDGEIECCAIITGPNMAGKSTYMRQVALIVIMAQMGSFVPADFAKVGIIDQIFTRIGAADDLAAGKSTFMVEMSEVANLLTHATSNSLLILDEIGRGTSTYDGMAIARSVVEFVRTVIGAKTLFATHYHELSSLESELEGVKNYNISAKKQGDSILFLRKIVPGGADQSYGVEVAKLAGVPTQVITRARELLEQLESK